MVDGVKMESSKVFDTFLCVDLTEGTHTVEFRYEPQGQKIGICISLVCALILGTIAWIDRRNRKKEIRNMFEKIREMIAENLNIDINTITEEASFKEDLGVDSLDLFELVMALEEEFGVEIPTEDLETLTTVGAVAKYVEEHQ